MVSFLLKRTRSRCNCSIHRKGTCCSIGGSKTRDHVNIGRGDENEVVIADPQVSRRHVELHFRDSIWTLVSIGRNGTILDGEKVTEIRLDDRQVFQLGSMGPSFKFVASIESANHNATIGEISPDFLEFLTIDENQKQDNVRQIVENDTFKALQEESRRLKQARLQPDA